MPEVRGIMIDFFNERPYYYQAKSHAESRALHKVYELLKGVNAIQTAITSIAIAIGCSNGKAYHLHRVHHGDIGTLLQAIAEMTAVLLTDTDKPRAIEVVFIDALHKYLLENQKNVEQKKNPLK